MFCTKCGTLIPEGGSCPNCNPVVQAPNTTAQHSVKLSKRQYILQLAPTSVKTFNLVGIIATILAIVFFVSCYFSVIFSSWENIPFVKLIENTSDLDIDEAKDQMGEFADQIDDSLDKIEEDRVDEELIDVTKETQKKIDDLSDSFSIKNLKDFLIVIEEFDDVYSEYPEYNEDPITFDDVNQIENILNIFIYFTFGFVVFCAIFTLFGGFFKKTGLVITGMIFTTLYTLVLCGVLFIVLGLILHILLIVSNVKVNSAYKKYKKSL